MMIISFVSSGGNAPRNQLHIVAAKLVRSSLTIYSPRARHKLLFYNTVQPIVPGRASFLFCSWRKFLPFKIALSSVCLMKWQGLRGKYEVQQAYEDMHTIVVIGPGCLLVLLALIVKTCRGAAFGCIFQTIRTSQFWSAACRQACRSGVGCRNVVDHATTHLNRHCKPSSDAVAPTQRSQQDWYHVRSSNQTAFLSLGNISFDTYMLAAG